MYRYGSGAAPTPSGEFMTEESGSDTDLSRVIEQIVELQREYFFENKGKDHERRKKLRDIIDRATPSGAA